MSRRKTVYWRLGNYEFGFGAGWYVGKNASWCGCEIYNLGWAFVTKLNGLCSSMEKQDE